MTEEDISKKVVGFASDGAMVMVGHLSGLAQRLKEQLSPRMVSTHCAAHRCNLVGERLGRDPAFVKVRIGSEPWEGNCFDSDILVVALIDSSHMF